MKFSMPILAVVVALLFVASQSVYTVDQRKYAVKFQLGEVIETKTTAGLYFKMPLVQNVKFYDKVNLTLDNPEPDRMTTSEKKPLLVDFVVLWRIIDVRQYYISVQGDEEAARRRLSQTVRANLAEEFNKHDVHEAISSARDAITSVTQQKANADAKSIGVEVIDVRLRRVELPPDVTGPVYQRMESERRRVANELRSLGGAESEKIRADADRQHHLKNRAVRQVACDRQPAAVIFHHRAADREPHAHAVGFGGEERIENALHILRIDAAAGIFHRDQTVGLMQLGFQSENTLAVSNAAHGVDRVHHQVDQDLA